MDNPLNKLVQVIRGREELVNAYRAVFENPSGERVLDHLAKNCHLFEPTFVKGDQYETALREGERRVVLSILKMLNTDLAKFKQMMENQNVP